MERLGNITITKALVAVAIVAAIVGVVILIVPSPLLFSAEPLYVPSPELFSAELIAYIGFYSFVVVALTLFLAVFGIAWKKTKFNNLILRVVSRILNIFVPLAVLGIFWKHLALLVILAMIFLSDGCGSLDRDKRSQSYWECKGWM